MPERVDARLLALLRCPVGRVPLVDRDDRLECPRCGLAFPIRDGIPVLLLEEAILPDGAAHISEICCGESSG